MKPARKFCHNCKGKTGWTCRDCGRQVCAHYCGNKVGSAATCGTCRLKSIGAWRKEP